MMHPSEDSAVRYLKSKKYMIVSRNYSVGLGEIDIVATRPNELHFVEVKSRKNNAFGRPEEYVTKSKQKSIIIAAKLFFQKHSEYSNHLICFDVIAIDYSDGNENIRMFENAFGE